MLGKKLVFERQRGRKLPANQMYLMTRQAKAGTNPDHSLIERKVVSYRA